MNQENPAILQTAKWIKTVVIENNFCPFAATAMTKSRIHYQVMEKTNSEACLEQLVMEWKRLDENSDIETSFLIFPEGFADFSDYLEFLVLAESLQTEMGYEGIYQVASFHPDYRFAQAPEDDPANYTNRSPYPMLHLLREASVENALQTFLHPEKIPQRNIDLARKLGLEKMEAALRRSRELD